MALKPGYHNVCVQLSPQEYKLWVKLCTRQNRSQSGQFRAMLAAEKEKATKHAVS